jgi:uncharacterized protein YqeY
MKNELNSLIMQAMKAHDTVRTEALRSIKGAILVWESAPDNIGKTLTEEDEVYLIRKLVKINQDTIDTCDDGKHDEIVNDARAKNAILEEFLPKPATEEDIKHWFDTIVAEGLEPVKKNMGLFVKQIKADLPNADGKMIAQFVQSHLN